ncbi:YhjD/YihY/BrkB family envelope integrity protein [Haloprofundus halobius]|uniref:YhjD/YihY/BrkB family envelope integrity protein n=1 Tax=Haloprofundus halobius TaxID=2876194 RepID=UPI001CCE9328|nr:YhjD/YihY/BrkB family envelope integrity protein [Haloprofundus halobius]
MSSASINSSSSYVGTARAVVTEVQEREVTFLAASISYYAFVSLIPLLVLAVVIAGLVGGEALRGEVMALAEQYLVPSAQDAVLSAMTDQAAQGGLGVVSFLLTTWGALKLFRGVDTAFSRVYGSETGGIADQVKDGLIVIGAIGAGVVGVIAVGAVIALLPIPYIGLIGPIMLLLTLCAAFFPLYYVFPDVDVTPREVLPGTVFAAVGWSILGAVFGIYAAASSGVGGLLGGILLLLTWFYFGGTIILVGAVVNAVLSNRLTDRQVQQEGARQEKPSDMSEEEARRAGEARRDEDVEPSGAPDISELSRQVAELQAELDAFESDVNERTVERPKLEAELKRYVRGQMRRGKARGWGPYLVLLYGTVLTLGAFFYLGEAPLIAVLAMLIIFLSTLGLYVIFVVVGVGLNALGVPSRAADWVRKRRS